MADEAPIETYTNWSQRADRKKRRIQSGHRESRVGQSGSQATRGRVAGLRRQDGGARCDEEAQRIFSN